MYQHGHYIDRRPSSLRPEPLFCLCGAPMILRFSTVYQKLFYGCTRSECKNTHGCHPDGRPLGIPADIQTRSLRQQAHRALMQVWDYTDTKERAKMYTWMAKHTTSKHVANMLKPELLELIGQLRDIKKAIDIH